MNNTIMTKMKQYEELTEKEKVIYNDVIEGLSYNEIAKKEYYSVSTVAACIKVIFQKLGYTNVRAARAKLTADHWREQLESKEKECEELKKQISKNRELTSEYINSGTKYQKALDAVEKMIKKDLCQSCVDYYCDYCDYKDTLDIINKAKEEENE